ncbi:MAG: hypothetical protein ACO39G_03720, partial [Flavobacteriaceae bacterium]
MAIEINKAQDFKFNGRIQLDFGTSSSSLTRYDITEIKDTEDYNLKVYVFEKEGLTPNTDYVYKWQLETNTPYGTLTTDEVKFTTPSGFDVLPYQLFEIPEEGLIPGDTIGYIKYEDTEGSWKKVQTYYKTTLGLKTDGTLWAWGRNAKNLVVNFGGSSEVIYEPIQVRLPPNLDDIDTDGDGFWDLDEEKAMTSATSSLSIPIDSDGDQFSDAFEEFLGTDPNNSDFTWEEEKKVIAFILENFSSDSDNILFHDFTLSRTAVLAIEKETRKLWFWGVGMGNVNLDLREYDLDQSHPNPNPVNP